MEFIHDLIGRGAPGGDIAWWQMCVRAGVIFLCGIVLVRLAGKRAFGRWGALDIVVSIIVGSNLSRAITGTAPFFETLAATATIVVLHGLLAMAATRVRWLGPLVKGVPCELVRDGRVDEAALKRHGVGQHDLEEALRSSGVEDVAQVKTAHIERNGDISIIKA